MRVIIVGGGLCGLAIADALEAAGRDYTLLEARDRFGGRIFSEHYGGGAFDMGPAWFWPGQPRIASLIDRLGLEKFDQYSLGLPIAEDEQGRVHRGHGFASMEGSWRLKGGMAAVTQALADGLPTARKRLNASASTLRNDAEGVAVALDSGEVIKGDRLVLAMPPRLAAQIAYDPSLPADAVQAMEGTATWMAGHAKALAIYDKPLWRAAGLSGDAVSRIGPMVEIHDASPLDEGLFALFGFIGVPPQGRMDEQLLRQQVGVQFGRLFGPEAAEPVQLYMKDWVFDPLTATHTDMEPLYAHPTYGMPRALSGLWDGRLCFAGTEVAPQFGGYIEGALEAAENALRTLND